MAVQGAGAGRADGPEVASSQGLLAMTASFLSGASAGAAAIRFVAKAP
jgi:hypothetical protein